MNNQKLLIKPEDLTAEDVNGYQGTFFTDASKEYIRWCAKEYFLFSSGNPGGGLLLAESDESGKGTTLRILENKPKFEELADLVSRGFVTRVDCLGAGEALRHVDDVVRNLLIQGKKVIFLPFTKNKPNLHGPQNPMGC